MADVNIPVPSVNLDETKNFLRVWKGGVAVFDEPALEFARDFANVVLKSFVVQQFELKMRAMKAVEAKEADKAIVEA